MRTLTAIPALTAIPPRHNHRNPRGLNHRSHHTLGIHQHHEPGSPDQPRSFARLIDAKAAGEMLGVPHTWLLAQARNRNIPHHRLGHYVRFNPEDLRDWLKETRQTPSGSRFQARR